MKRRLLPAWPVRGSLGRTLLLLGAAQSLVVVVTAAALVWANDRMLRSLDDATDAFVEEQWMADRIHNGVTRQLVAVSAFRHQQDERFEREFRAAGAEVHEQLRRYLFRDLSSAQRLQLEEVKERHQRLEVAAARSIQLLELGNTTAATAAEEAMVHHAVALGGAAEDFIGMRHADLQELRARQRRAARRLYGAAALFGLLVLASSLGVAHFIYRRLAAPLAELADAAGRIGTGDLDVRVEPPAEDELAAVADSFNQMAGALAATRADLQRRNEELGTALDQLRETQDELVQTEKLSAMGRMVAGLAHELNNPLASVLGYAELLKTRLGEDGEAGISMDELGDHVQPIVREATRARQLVQNLLSFSRKSETRLGPVSVREAVRIVTGLRSYAFQQAGLHLDVEALPDLWVRAEAQRLQQVLLNIINNAYDAMRPAGEGRLVIRARRADERVEVVVEDEGPGFANPERVFEPFYTTKAVGEGTGLGLALVHRFTQEFGGRVHAENRPEGGARLTLVLQAASPAPAGPTLPPAGEPPAPPARTGDAVAGPAQPVLRPLRVLVVEDEAPLRALQKKLLARLGADVLLASAGEEAASLLAAEEVDLVISDVKMPGGSGVELYRWVEKERPDLLDRFLFVTGDVGDPEIAALAAARPDRFIHKPFRMADYIRRVSAFF